MSYESYTRAVAAGLSRAGEGARRAEGTTILVVDDEPIAGELCAWILRQGGFQVVSVRKASTALALCEVRHIDLVIAKLRLPGISGLELLRWLRRRRLARAGVLLASCDRDELDLVDQDDETPILESPTSAGELLEIVRATLAEPDRRTWEAPLPEGDTARRRPAEAES